MSTKSLKLAVLLQCRMKSITLKILLKMFSKYNRTLNLDLSILTTKIARSWWSYEEKVKNQKESYELGIYCRTASKSSPATVYHI
jgi:hypothetical protein